MAVLANVHQANVHQASVHQASVHQVGVHHVGKAAALLEGEDGGAAAAAAVPLHLVQQDPSRIENSRAVYAASAGADPQHGYLRTDANWRRTSSKNTQKKSLLKKHQQEIVERCRRRAGRRCFSDFTRSNKPSLCPSKVGPRVIFPRSSECGATGPEGVRRNLHARPTGAIHGRRNG